MSRVQSLHIDQVLAMIERWNKPEGFSLEFVRSTGQDIGQVIKKTGVRKGRPNHVPIKRTAKRRKDGSERKSSLHKHAYTIPLVEIKSDRYFTPLISHIIKFNGVPVGH